jgi:hypothetical protein
MPNLSGLKEENFDNISIQGVDVTTDVFSTTKKGLVPASEISNTTDFLRRDGTFSTVPSPAVGDGGLTQKNFTTELKTKLDGIEASADITDTTNVTAAGALMDTELTDLAGIKALNTSTLQVKPSEGAFANGDKTKLDGIDTNANNYVLPSSVQFQPSEGAFANGDKTKLDGIPTIPAPSASDATKVITVSSGGAYELGDGASSTYDTTLDGGIKVGTTVGAFNSGDSLTSLGITNLTITQILDKMLFPDTNPTISNNQRGGISFTSWSAGTVKVNYLEDDNITINVNKGNYTSNISTAYCGDITAVSIILDPDLNGGNSVHKTFDLTDLSNVGYTDAINAGETQIYFRSQTSDASPQNDGKYVRFNHVAPPNNGATPPVYSASYSRASLYTKVTFGTGPTPLSSHGNPFTRTSPSPAIPCPDGFELQTQSVTKYAVFPIYIGNDSGNSSLTDSEGMETNYTEMTSLPNILFFDGGTNIDRNNMFDDSTAAKNDLKITIATQSIRISKYCIEFNQDFAEDHTNKKIHKIAIPKAFYDQRSTDEPVIFFDNQAGKYISTAGAFTGNASTSKYVINNIKLDGGFGSTASTLVDYVEFKKNVSLTGNQNINTTSSLLLTITP